MDEDTEYVISTQGENLSYNMAHPSTNSLRNSASFVRRPLTSAALPSNSFSLLPPLLEPLRFLSPSRCLPTISASFSTAAATSHNAVSTSSATTVAVWRKLRIWEDDMAITHVCNVAIRSEVYNDPSSADDAMRRSKNSDRDFRNFLNTGSLDVRG